MNTKLTPTSFQTSWHSKDIRETSTKNIYVVLNPFWNNNLTLGLEQKESFKLFIEQHLNKEIIDMGQGVHSDKWYFSTRSKLEH